MSILVYSSSSFDDTDRFYPRDHMYSYSIKSNFSGSSADGLLPTAISTSFLSPLQNSHSYRHYYIWDKFGCMFVYSLESLC